MFEVAVAVVAAWKGNKSAASSMLGPCEMSMSFQLQSKRLCRLPETGEFTLDVYRRGELDQLDIRLEVVSGEPEVVAAVEKEIRLGLGFT